MLVSVLESLKHVGHLWPLAILRIYIGYYFMGEATRRVEGDFLLQPQLASAIAEWLPMSSAPEWYRLFLEYTVIPNWRLFSYFIVYTEGLLAFSFILGFFVRPVAFIGAVASILFVFPTTAVGMELNQLHFVIFVVMMAFGAGRCLGVDYYFYKRDRGLWW